MVNNNLEIFFNIIELDWKIRAGISFYIRSFGWNEEFSRFSWAINCVKRWLIMPLYRWWFMQASSAVGQFTRAQIVPTPLAYFLNLFQFLTRFQLPTYRIWVEYRLYFYRNYLLSWSVLRLFEVYIDILKQINFTRRIIQKWRAFINKHRTMIFRIRSH